MMQTTQRFKGLKFGVFEAHWQTYEAWQAHHVAGATIPTACLAARQARRTNYLGGTPEQALAGNDRDFDHGVYKGDQLSRSSAMTYKAGRKSMAEIARELNVEATAPRRYSRIDFYASADA